MSDTNEIVERLRDVQHGHTVIDESSDLPKLAADEIDRLLNFRDDLLDWIERSYNLIGDQRGDITGAALDAWILLGDARRAAAVLVPAKDKT